MCVFLPPVGCLNSILQTLGQNLVEHKERRLKFLTLAASPRGGNGGRGFAQERGGVDAARVDGGGGVVARVGGGSGLHAAPTLGMLWAFPTCTIRHLIQGQDDRVR